MSLIKTAINRKYENEKVKKKNPKKSVGIGLIEALETGTGLTENGMATNLSTGDSLVNLFGKIGSMRTSSDNDVIALFTSALAQDTLNALKILFWTRDVRGGAGERKVFKTILKYLAVNHTEAIKQNMMIIPEYGRWDDMLAFFGTPLEKKALWAIHIGLTAGDDLCRKWMPRKGEDQKKIRAFLQVSPKEYRGILVKGNTVEQSMSARDWEGINYEHIPSVAMSRYSKAFKKHNAQAYQDFVASPEKLKKINAEALYPYDVLRTLAHGDTVIAQAQWDNLPNFVKEGERVLPVVDTSGSMGSLVSESKNVTCLDVAISIGMYLAEKNAGVFKDHFITFSERPELQHLTGKLVDKVKQLRTANWNMNTNLEAVYRLILDRAVKNRVDESEMPTKIIILSDMEFDPTAGTRYGVGYNYTAHQMVKKIYRSAGYATPTIVYWNLHARKDNNPVRFDEEGTQFVSGFSPAILKACLTGDPVEIDTRTPEEVMMEVLNGERYDMVRYEVA